jgi:hypothetical protein
MGMGVVKYYMCTYVYMGWLLALGCRWKGPREAGSIERIVEE